ncbi:MAG: hypothetical protein KDA61_02385, partial [Planctomycetales bacterium]|nr:hypothetical protein [Planctomycetales bacterium]
MNLIGKILVIVILIASLFLLAVSMLVYASHTNWREAYQGLNERLTSEQASNAELKSRYDNQIQILEAEKEAAQQDVRKLESERTTLVSQNAAIQSEIDELRAERRR